MRGLGLGFTNPMRTGGMLDVCLGCGGVCGELVAGLDEGLEGWGGDLTIFRGAFHLSIGPLYLIYGGASSIGHLHSLM